MTKNSDVPSVLFLTAKAYRNNPMLKMYGSAFSEGADCFFSCSDSSRIRSDEVRGVTLLRCPRFFWAYFIRVSSWLGLGRLRRCGWFSDLCFFLLVPLFLLDYFFSNLRHLIIIYIRFYKRGVPVVVSVDGDFLCAAYLFSRLTSSKFVYSVYEIWPNQLPDVNVFDRAAKFAMTWIERFYSRRATNIITVTGVWSKFLRRRYGIPASRFIVAPVCPEPVEVPVSTLNDGGLKVHYHGAFLLSRGLAELVRSFKGLEGVALFLRGFGPDEAALRKLVEDLNLSEKIHFLPPVSVHELVKQGCDYDVGVILAMPDTANGRMCTGFKCFEYLNSGLALLAPSSFPLQAIVRDYKCGVTYGWPDESVFREELVRLSENKERLLALKAAARAASNFFNSSVQSSALRSELLGNING